MTATTDVGTINRVVGLVDMAIKSKPLASINFAMETLSLKILANAKK